MSHRVFQRQLVARTERHDLVAYIKAAMLYIPLIKNIVGVECTSQRELTVTVFDHLKWTAHYKLLVVSGSFSLTLQRPAA